MDWLSFVQVMIVDEKGAFAKYKIAADKATDPKIKAMFEQFADEEKVHIDILEQREQELQKLLSK